MFHTTRFDTVSFRAMNALAITPARAVRHMLAPLAVCVAVLLAWPLAAQHAAPSKPFLEKTGFYLRSAGFRIQLANDAAGQRALKALPPHRFVIHRTGSEVRYLYAEPVHCVCIFIGTAANYQNYRDILARPVDQPDNVAPDYKTQASALLYGDPYDWNSLNRPSSISDYLRTYY